MMCIEIKSYIMYTGNAFDKGKRVALTLHEPVTCFLVGIQISRFGFYYTSLQKTKTRWVLIPTRNPRLQHLCKNNCFPFFPEKQNSAIFFQKKTHPINLQTYITLTNYNRISNSQKILSSFTQPISESRLFEKKNISFLVFFFQKKDFFLSYLR